MVFIPGWLISIATFPGVIIHELGHKLFCDWSGVKVLKVCYFRFGNPAGYVIHEPASSFKQSFLITVGPFIIGTLLATIIFLLISPLMSILDYFLIWLGVSIAMNSFPSSADAKNLWKESNKHVKHSVIAVIGYPLVLIIWVINLFRIIWFDLFYALGLYYIVINLF